MKKVLWLALVMVFSANLAFAQAGAINIFADPGGTICDHIPPIGTLYVAFAVHVLTPGATASNWSAPMPACSQPWALWLADGQVFPVTIGNSQMGVAIGYGACLGSPIHILTIQLFIQGAIPNCCLWPVLPDPAAASGKVEVVDCANNLVTVASKASSVFNPDPTCSCTPPIPTKDSTWGGVKSLYAE